MPLPEAGLRGKKCVVSAIWLSRLSYSQVPADKAPIDGKPQIVCFTINIPWSIYKRVPSLWIKIRNILKRHHLERMAASRNHIWSDRKVYFLYRCIVLLTTHIDLGFGLSPGTCLLISGIPTTTSVFFKLGLAEEQWNLNPPWICSSVAHHDGSEPWFVFWLCWG